MKKSRDTSVQNFLDELKKFDSEKYAIVQKARDSVFLVCPQVSERIMYGGIMFTLEKDFGGLFVSKHHVSFEFTEGYTFSDPDSLLEGTGKFRRHIKIKTLSDIANKKVKYYIKQAL